MDSACRLHCADKPKKKSIIHLHSFSAFFWTDSFWQHQSVQKLAGCFIKHPKIDQITLKLIRRVDCIVHIKHIKSEHITLKLNYVARVFDKKPRKWRKELQNGASGRLHCAYLANGDSIIQVCKYLAFFWTDSFWQHQSVQKLAGCLIKYPKIDRKSPKLNRRVDCIVHTEINWTASYKCARILLFFGPTLFDSISRS